MEFLVSGYIVHVDEEDAHLFDEHNWFASKTGHSIYFQAKVRIGGKLRNVSLHRMIMNAPKGAIVDHRDCDTLNCRRGNLRIVGRAANSQNTPKHIIKTSRFKGVHWVARLSLWRATIAPKRCPIFLGYFKSEAAAAFAYDRASMEHFGEYRRGNFLPFVF
ncbi:hypothetical protein QF001_000915 [Paraburkholderia youngii]|uniref:HNH endonuclease n=1 Tax=Paraburkholderia youngii TaxID=2782701 RepID=UPI003D231125